jgi:hypothetical protein
MAIHAFSVTKRTAFRDSTQEWSNVYHYDVDFPFNDAELERNLIEIVDAEKTWHSTAVSFVRGRVWSAGGTIAENQMRVDRILSGTGSTALFAAVDRERAILVQWPAGLDSRGKQVYLRKWYHPCGVWPGVSFSDAVLGQTTGFSAAQRTSIANTVNVLTSTGLANEHSLVGPTGRATTGPIEAHPYFEHHQLGDQWRQT